MDELNPRLKRIYSALGKLESSDLSEVKLIRTDDEGAHHKADFSNGQDQAEIENSAALLITNIASIKDHLKSWCKKKNVKFNGEDLINNDINVALIHDLWNVDKHAELDKSPRSGHTPELKKLCWGVSISVTPMANETSGAGFIISSSEEITPDISGGGAINRILFGDIVDEKGNKLGDFVDVCKKAITAWESELAKADVNLS